MSGVFLPLLPTPSPPLPSPQLEKATEESSFYRRKFHETQDALSTRLASLSEDNAWLEALVGRLNAQVHETNTQHLTAHEAQRHLERVLASVQSELERNLRGSSERLAAVESRAMADRTELERALADREAQVAVLRAQAESAGTSTDALEREVASLRVQLEVSGHRR